MENTSPTPTSDEKLMSAIAYFLGIIGALLVWILQKDKSRFVRYHAAQALAFDFLVTVLAFVMFFCIFGVMFVGLFGSILIAVSTASQTDSAPLFVLFPAFMPFMVFTCAFPLSFVFMIGRLFAAISVLTGRDFRFPWLGRQVEKFLGGSI